MLWDFPSNIISMNMDEVSSIKAIIIQVVNELSKMWLVYENTPQEFISSHLELCHVVMPLFVLTIMVDNKCIYL